MISVSYNKRVVLLVALIPLAACANKPVAVSSSVPSPPVIRPSPPLARSAPPPALASGIAPGSEQDLRVNVGDTVHFAFNQYDIEDSDKGTLQKQANWLARYPRVRVTIEGNADERGTREYNLALGARRANSVKEYLVGLGISSARVDTISYGKERPVCTDSNESCWAQNRRDVTVVASAASS